MKTPPLLFSLPLLVSVLAVQVQAAPGYASDMASTKGELPNRSITRDKSLMGGIYQKPVVQDKTLLAGYHRMKDLTIDQDVKKFSSTPATAIADRSASVTAAISEWTGSTPAETTSKDTATTSKDTASTPPAGSEPTTSPEVTSPAEESTPVEVPDVSRAACETRVLRIRGRKKTVDILTDRVHISPLEGAGAVQDLPGAKKLQDTDLAAAVHDVLGTDRANLIAYPKGRPRTDANKLLLTPQVCVRLAPGVAFSSFATHSGAIIAERPIYAEEAVILTFATTLDALDAVDRFNAMDAVLGAHIIVAQLHIPEFMPTSTYFGVPPAGPEYSPRPKVDNVDGWQPLPYLAEILGTRAYQWWANNHTALPVPAPLMPVPAELFLGTIRFGCVENEAPFNPLRVDLGDFPPIAYRPALPLFSGEMADIRLPLAWENKAVLFDQPVSGFRKSILIIDDGIQTTHPDLFQAVDQNPQRHWNYFTEKALPQPQTPADSHGTSMAAIAGARIRQGVGSKVTGVAPGCLFHSVVALKRYVSDFEWADAFAFSAPPNSGPTEEGGGPPEGENRGTLKDTNHDNEWLDESRSGIVFFEVALNAQTNLGSQDATDMFTEDWLWKRAIRFSATHGNQTRGVPFITSSGNGGDGHMDLNYMELKNCIYQIPVGGVSEMGRRIATSVGGAPLVCVAPTWGQELPPYLNWPNSPPSPLWPTNRPFTKNAPIGPDDVVSQFRRVTQGITSATTVTTNNPAGIDFNLTGTSTSAAMVAGICALMMEVNTTLKARDIKEILMRSSRVCGDIRVDRGPSSARTDDDIIKDDAITVRMGGEGTNNGVAQDYRIKTGQLWRMAPMGHPIHPFFGAGIIDADKAVKMARKWTSLPPNPLPPIQQNVLKDGFGELIGVRNTETGGQYFPNAIIRTIPVNGDYIEIPVAAPPSGMRVEHIEVRVKFHHKRRGDMEITLVAPGEAGWEAGRTLESELFVPHRDDYNEDVWVSNFPELNDPMDWTFTTVRHWGTQLEGSKSGEWKLRVRDAISQGQTVETTRQDPVFVPVENPLQADMLTQRIVGVGMTYHGVFQKLPRNSAPTVTTGGLRFEPSTTATSTAQMIVDELGRNQQTGEIIFPVTSWDFWSNTVRRVDGLEVPVYTPMQPTAPPVDYFEFFPPQARDAVDPTIHRPISFLGFPWPLQPDAPMWVSFELNPAARPATWPAPPVDGPVGALTQRPRWLQMTPDELWMIVRDQKNSNPATNFIHMRLNRRTGLMEVNPHNKGRYFFNVYAENMLGLSKPKEIEITVTAPGFQSWADLFWDPPELNEPNAWEGDVSGWLADPDKDGIVNGMEYALRLDPLIPDDGQIPSYRIEENEPGPEDDEIVFTWTKDLTAIDATLIPQISEDLENWGDVTSDVDQVGTVNTMATMEYRVPVSGDTRLYFRLWSDYNKHIGNP